MVICVYELHMFKFSAVRDPILRIINSHRLCACRRNIQFVSPFHINLIFMPGICDFLVIESCFVIKNIRNESSTPKVRSSYVKIFCFFVQTHLVDLFVIKSLHNLSERRNQQDCGENRPRSIGTHRNQPEQSLQR